MPGLISEATKEQVRAANDIVDVIGAAIPLKRAGATFRALCPFHKEKTPSFHVNPRRQSFYCFGCHKGGDVFTFIREYEGLDFMGALKRLAERARIPLQFDDNPQARDDKFLKDRLLEIHEQLAQRWQVCLSNDAAGQRARDYLAQRRVSPEAVKLFRLGFAPDSWDDTVHWARSKNYDPALVEQAGLILRKENSDHFYNRFRGRLMFPICDEQGRVIGFSGRVLPGDPDERKYVNSPETPLFTKSRVMFGLDKSKRALLDQQSVIICEGQLDLIACFMAGVQNVVAPQGTAFTAEHARILKRYVKEAVLCFDSDNAGQRATVRVLDDLLASGLAIRVASVPSPHDPDSYIKEFGAHAFRQVVADAEDFFEFYLNRLCATNDLGSDRGRQTVVAAMAEAIGKAQARDQTLFDKYARRTAARLGLSPTAPMEAFRRLAAAPRRAAAEPEEGAAEAPRPEMPAPARYEYWLLRLLLACDEVLDWARAHLDPAWIAHATVRTITAHRLAHDADGNPVSPHAILDQLPDADAQALVSQALVDEHPPLQPEQIAEVAARVRNAQLDRRLTEILQELGTPDLPAEDGRRLLEEQSALRINRKTPLPAFKGF